MSEDNQLRLARYGYIFEIMRIVAALVLMVLCFIASLGANTPDFVCGIFWEFSGVLLLVAISYYGDFLETYHHYRSLFVAKESFELCNELEMLVAQRLPQHNPRIGQLALKLLELIAVDNNKKQAAKLLHKLRCDPQNMKIKDYNKARAWIKDFYKILES